MNMKNRMLTSVLVLAVAVGVWAGQVGEKLARQKASAFMTGEAATRGEVSLTRVYLPLQTKSAVWSVTEAPIYVFNYDGGGYVIVSGDDRTADILGFSKTGHIDADRLPVNMKNWLQGYATKIERLSASAVLPRKATTRGGGTKANLPTKMKTDWGQDYPYNLHAPELAFSWKSKDTIVYAATGCVATATSMVMNYYQYPEKLKKAIASYEGTCDIPVSDTETGEVDTIRNVKWKTENIAAGTPIDWNHVTDNYNRRSTDVEKEAVSRLMQYSGCAAHMNYGFDGSGADIGDMLIGLKEVFGYNDVYFLNQFEYDDEGWVDAVYYEMSKAGPLVFGGDTPSGEGHEFVLDGYMAKDGKDYFYVNWGWNGEDNGYMLLDVMQPGWLFDDEGNPEGFTEFQHILCGMGHNGKGYTTVPNRVFYADIMELGLEGKEYRRSRKSEPFEVTEYYISFGNYHLPELTSRTALGVYDANNKLVTYTTMSEEEGMSLPIYNYVLYAPDSSIKDDSFPIGDGVDDGTYTLKLLCAEPNTGDWIPMQNAEEITLKMTVSGNKCTFKVSKTTAIRKVVTEITENTDHAWYSLSGTRLNGKPTTKGVYIHQGRKVMVK